VIRAVLLDVDDTLVDTRAAFAAAVAHVVARWLPHLDGEGREAAGLLGVWLDRHGSGQSPPDVPVVRSLDELPTLLGIAPAGGRAR
jgi:beta-phosphoglucomutase-like phosphatase (HAD superfamily)